MALAEEIEDIRMQLQPSAFSLMTCFFISFAYSRQPSDHGANQVTGEKPLLPKARLKRVKGHDYHQSCSPV